MSTFSLASLYYIPERVIVKNDIFWHNETCLNASSSCATDCSTKLMILLNLERRWFEFCSIFYAFLMIGRKPFLVVCS